MMRILFVLFAFVTTGCGKSACEELEDCLGEGAEVSDDAEEEDCEKLLEASDC